MSIKHTQTILSALAQPTFISSLADGEILFTNDSLARMFAVTSEAIVGQNITRYFIDPADQQEILRLIEKQGSVHEMEIQIKRPDGEKIWVIVSSHTFSYGDTPALLTSLVDVTNHKKAETLLKQRARQMETVSQVSAFTSSILETSKLLQAMVDLTKDQFDLYHSHVYLLNKQKSKLNLVAGAGNIGRQMVAEKRTIFLDKEKSLVALAARTRQGVIENNVRENPNFLPHPLLPKTKSEMAIPMLVGDTLIGVLDVQSSEVDYFAREDVHVHTALAAQLAVAVQNARSFERAQQSLTETQALLDITYKTSNLLDLDEMLHLVLDRVLATTKFESGLVSMYNAQIDDLELLVHQLPQSLYDGIQKSGLKGSLCDLVFRQQKPIVVTDLTKETPVDATGLVDMGYRSYQGMPLRHGDEVLGTLCIFYSKPLALGEANTEFLLAVAQQIGAAIRNAQAYEQSQAALAVAKRSEEILALRTRELDELTHRLTREGWDDFFDNVSDRNLRFLFDGKSVQEVQDIAETGFLGPEYEGSLVQPIKIRGVPIGNLAVQPEEEDPEVEAVINSVMDQLSAHIENLRLTEQVQTALAQTEALYSGSERIVLSSTEGDILESLIFSTELRKLDRANIFLFDEPVEDGMVRDVTAVAIWENENVPRTVEVGTRFTVEQVPFMTMITPENSMVVTNIWEDPRIDEATRQILESFGMVSFVLFPMVVGSQWLGIVSGQSGRPLQVNDVQRRQASSLVSQASVVLQTTILFRQEQARARREQLLREIASKVRSSVDVDTVMRTAVTEIGRTLGRRAFIELGTSEPDNGQKLNGAT